MKSRAIITSASNKFFPSLINLLGSIKKNFPQHPPVYIYNLGLLWTFKKELEKIPGVTVLEMPQFVPFWRSCYTWKPYIFKHPFADLNFYLDAGCQVLRPLDEVFEAIEHDGMFLIYQGGVFNDIVPGTYQAMFGLSSELGNLQNLHAGIFGFSKQGPAQEAIDWIFEAASMGLALGFSPAEAWRNKGVNKNPFWRDCKLFRHDMTLLNIAFRKFFGNKLTVHAEAQYAGGKGAHSRQFIWQMRLGYSWLEFLKPSALHAKIILAAWVNRAIVYGLILAKNINLSVKKRLGLAK